MRVSFIILVFYLILFLAPEARSQPASPDEAGQLAAAFLKADIYNSQDVPELAGIIPDSKQKPAIYIFRLPEQGFILMSADKAAFPVLAYSHRGDWPSGELPGNTDAWIDNYISQIDQIRSSKLKPDQKIRDAWEHPLPFFTRQFNQERSVAPLIISFWNQGVFYNDSCPLEPQGAGGRALAGCVPVALAQILFFHRYPERGTGYNAYFSHEYGTLSADFGNTTYEWAGMLAKPDRFSPSLSQMIYHCGVSVNAVYSANGTSASTADAAPALIQYFGYADEAVYHNKTDFSDSAWTSMIRLNLGQKQPLIYKGSAGGLGGHAWVCDGFEGDDYFHFNWGWSGFADGYYYLDNLNPGNYDFTFGQGAVFNIHPGISSPVVADADTISTTSGTLCNAFWPQSDTLISIYTRLISPQQSNTDYIQIKPEMVQLLPGDSLLIYKGTSTDFPPEIVFTSDNPPSTVHLESHSALIRSVCHSGNNLWALSYLAHNGTFCNNNAVFRNLNGFIYDGSGNFDLNPQTDCRWQISPEDETLDSVSAIQIDFHKFDLSASDTVYIYEGLTVDSPLLARIPGDVQPEMIQSTGNKLLVRMVTDSLSVSSDGIVIIYYSVLPEYCRDVEVLTDFSGTISNGSLGHNYHNNTLCQWLLQPEDNAGFVFTFSSLDTEPNRDRIEFYSAWSYPEQLLKVVSGNEIPEPFTIDGSRVRVIFRSDNSIVHKGWELSYQGKPLSVDPTFSSNNKVYPVPVGDVLYVDLPVAIQGGEYTIRNSTGYLIQQAKTGAGTQIEINTSTLLPGIYLLSIKYKEIFQTFRFIKQ
ncbi:MAG: C10 family peptidase [Bacteroidales bacterium]|nr:C10 family peptidase [Bacteroidales bacterium]